MTFAVFILREQCKKIMPHIDTRIVGTQAADPVIVFTSISGISTTAQIAREIRRFIFVIFCWNNYIFMLRQVITQFAREEPPQTEIFFQKAVNAELQTVFAAAGNDHSVFIGESKAEFLNIAVQSGLDLQFDGVFEFFAIDRQSCPGAFFYIPIQDLSVFGNFFTATLKHKCSLSNAVFNQNHIS